MTSVTVILLFIQYTLLVLTILLALIYVIPIIFIPRFHKVNYVFTVNLCFAAICCGMYWLISIKQTFGTFEENSSDAASCLALDYFAMMCTIQFPLATIEVSVHRLCSVVYPRKLFFKKKPWVITCIVSQWLCGIIFSLPQLATIQLTCQSLLWLKIYTLIMVVIFPSLSCLILNFIIFKYVRTSSNRIQAISRSNQQLCLNRRDLHLLRHMILIFCIFVGGWSPVYLYTIIAREDYNSIKLSIFIILSVSAILIDIINLFFYNHELRRYLLKKIFRY